MLKKKIDTNLKKWILTLGLVLAGIQLSWGQMQSMPLEPIHCPATFQDAHSALTFNFPTARLAQTAAFEATYENVPTEAQAAFEYAMGIWGSVLVSAVPIRIKVTFSSLASSTLASSGATRIFRDFPNAPFRSVWYPVALAESIRGAELNNRETDINVTINQNIRWSYATDGRPVTGAFDFVTVVLHEIGHGLGFVSSFKTNTANSAQGEFGQGGFPFIFDLFIQNTSGQNLTDTGLFGNPSTDLLAQMTSGQLQFSLSGIRRVSPLPRLFAPNPYTAGNSISHLNESSYPQGNTNSLMTPNVRSAEIIHQPGDLTRRILNQIGWGVTNLVDGLVTAIEPAKPEVTVFPNPAQEEVQIHFPTYWSGQRIQIALTDPLGRMVMHQSLEISGEPVRISVQKLATGMYFLRLTSSSDETVVKRILVSPTTSR